MTNSSITTWSIGQIVASALGFLMFSGMFTLNYADAKKAGFMALFAELSCVGFSVYSLILNCTAQTNNPAQHRGTDMSILLYGIYYNYSLLAMGYAFYWMVIVSKPNVIIIMSTVLRQFATFVVITHVIILAFMTRLAWITLNYLSTNPNAYGVSGNEVAYIVVNVKK